MTIIINSPTVASIPVSDLLVRLDNLMSDDDRTRWDEAERIRWFNDAAREIVMRRPAARAVTQNIALVEGAFQETPAGTAQVLDIMRNMEPGGAGGGAITLADRLLIDRADPDWHTSAPGTTRHYMLDDRSPTTFYVYPPAVAGAVVEALLSEPPNEVTSASDSIDMRPEFMNAIINWALYRCHTKDSEYAQGAVAAQHYQAFTDAIGAPAQIAQANSAKGNSV